MTFFAATRNQGVVNTRPLTCLRLWSLICVLSSIFAGPRLDSACAEESAPDRPRGWFDPLLYRDTALKSCERVRHIEFVEMMSAVLKGADMGPNDGWFRHGSESRYGWQWLTQLHGIAADGRILKKDFQGPPEVFDRLDRNHDGQLRKDDFDWSYNSAFVRMTMPSGYWFRAIDTNSNGRISREEWDAFFTKIAKEKKYLTPEDLQEAFPTMPPPRRVDEPPSKDEGPSPLILLTGLLTGELGSPLPGPIPGQMAPDFRLPTQDGKGEIALSQFRGKKHVVLIFGSFT
jgi:hypothetical protein